MPPRSNDLLISPSGQRRSRRLSAGRSGAAAMALLAVATACRTGEEPRGNAVTVVDSAGIQIVENSGPAWREGQQWRISADPVLEIGMAEGPTEYLLTRVHTPRRRRDGAIVLANSGSSEIRIYGADGAHLRSSGRKGSGPGEFDFLSWLQLLPGDSLLAYDYRARRLSLFSPDGEFVRSATLEQESARSFVEMVGSLPDRSLIAGIPDLQGLEAPPGEVRRMPVRYIRFSQTGELMGTLTEQPGSEMTMQESNTADGLRMISISPPLFARRQVAAVVGDRAVFGTNERYELQVMASDGTVQRLIRRVGDPRPVTDAMIEAGLSAELDDARDQAARRRQEEALRSGPRPSTLPFYHDIAGDDEGNLWVQEYAVPGDSAPGWVVYDPEGRLLGSVQLPESFHPTHIGADFVLGLGTDDLGIERVRMYELEKPS